MNKSGDMQVFESLKKEVLSKRGTHICHTIRTEKDPDVWGGTFEQAVLEFLEDMNKGKYFSCPECGGILPEIEFFYKHRYYKFVCTKITDGKGNIIAETDYKLLEEQCHRINRKKRVGISPLL